MEFTLEIITGIIAIITVTYVVIVYYFLREVIGGNQSRKILRERFFNVLSESLRHGEINSFHDVQNLYLGVCKLSPVDDYDPSVIVRWLREYVVERLEASDKKTKNAESKQAKASASKQLDSSRQSKQLESPESKEPEGAAVSSVATDNQWKKRIAEIIREYEEQNPNAMLPDLERTIIDDIRNYLGANDKESIDRKLEEMKTAIQNRNKQLSRLQKTNQWATPLAIMGVVFAVVFGIMILLIV